MSRTGISLLFKSSYTFAPCEKFFLTDRGFSEAKIPRLSSFLFSDRL